MSSTSLPLLSTQMACIGVFHIISAIIESAAASSPLTHLASSYTMTSDLPMDSTSCVDME